MSDYSVSAGLKSSSLGPTLLGVDNSQVTYDVVIQFLYAEVESFFLQHLTT